ncbi:MAG: ATP-binding protein [Lautropia sp.]
MEPAGSARRRPLGLLPAGMTGRALLVVCTTLLVAFGVSGAWTASEQYRMARENLRRQAAAMARTIAASSEDFLVRQNLDLAEQLLERTMHFDEVLSIRILDAAGHTLSHLDRSADGRPQVRFDSAGTTAVPPASPRARVDDALVAQTGRIVAWEPIVAGRMLGWVRLDFATEQLAVARHRIWKTTLAAALLSCGFSALLLTVLMRSPMRSLRAASEFARTLEQQSDRRLASTEGPTEIAHLCAALNIAAERLSRHKAQIDANLFHLMSQEAELTDSNNQLGTLFALSPDGLASIDASNQITLANASLTRMVGLGSESLQGRCAEFLDERLKRACADPDGFGGLATLFDTHGQRAPRASRLTIEATGRRVLEIVGVVATSSTVRKLLYVRDVTRETEVEQMKSEFLSTAAHELRTPMSSIFGFTELLMTREYPPERRVQMQGKVHRQCRAMMGILDELLDLSRLEARAGKDFELAAVDLRDLVDAAVQDFQPPPGRNEIAWVRPSAQPALVRVDRSKMMQVMLNLISNAYKYSPDGGPVSITLSVCVPRPQGLRHGVSVHDRGIGMTPAQAARIFERFYRADKSGRIAGTGLGMSIVREILALLGGEIEVDSEHGVGTVMHVWLPPLAVAQDAPPAVRPVAAPTT